MKIILNDEIVGLGEEGDVITVSDGYARNFLFPNKQAVLFNNQNVAELESKKDAIHKRRAARRASYASLKEKLDSKTLVIKVKTGEAGHLYGAVTATVIADQLEKEGIEIFKKQIIVPNHGIKYIGTYPIEVKLQAGIVATITVIIEDIDGKKEDIVISADDSNHNEGGELQSETGVTETVQVADTSTEVPSDVSDTVSPETSEPLEAESNINPTV